MAGIILQPQYTDNLQNICEGVLQIHFKVAVRNFHDFIQVGDSLTDVSAHYHAG